MYNSIPGWRRFRSLFWNPGHGFRTAKLAQSWSGWGNSYPALAIIVYVWKCTVCHHHWVIKVRKFQRNHLHPRASLSTNTVHGCVSVFRENKVSILLLHFGIECTWNHQDFRMQNCWTSCKRTKIFLHGLTRSHARTHAHTHEIHKQMSGNVFCYNSKRSRAVETA